MLFRSFTFTANCGGVIADGTYSSGLTMRIWQNFWEPASSKDILDAIWNNGNGAKTYVDGALGCTPSVPCTPVETLTKWVFRGLTPQNPLYYYTFPGDTNTVTNLGPSLMIDRSKAGAYAGIVQ